MHFNLVQQGGLYYCDTNVFTVDRDLVQVRCHCAVTQDRKKPPQFVPTSRACQVELEVWLLRFGSPGEHQLDVLPSNVVGTPATFEYHPFCSIDFKEQAYIRKQAAGRTAERIPTCGAEFFMDFAFMCASTEDYKCPNKYTDWIVTSYDGYSSHPIIVDSASRRVWAFLTKSKEPPIDILRAFLKKFGIGMGVIRTDQGGKLARSDSFCDTMLKEFGYVVKPMGADSPCRTVVRRATITHSPLRFALSYTVQVSLHISGLLHSYMRCTCTTDLYILPPARLRTRDGTDVNPMYHTLKLLACGSA